MYVAESPVCECSRVWKAREMLALCNITCQLRLGFPSPSPPLLRELFLSEALTRLPTSTSILGPVSVAALWDHCLETANSFTETCALG